MRAITAFGAAGEVTGSKHLLEADGARILVDCGVFQGRREEAYRKNSSFPFDPASMAAAVNSHGHLDHCGSYPLLAKKGFAGDIVSTSATRDLAALVMMDSAHIQAHDSGFLEKQQRKRPQPWRKIMAPLFDERDVNAALRHYVAVDYGRPRQLADGVALTLYDAGHILGSAMARFEIGAGGGGLAVGFTGDLGRRNMPIIRDPETLPPVDYLVCESTYGDRLHDPMETAMDDLAEAIKGTAARGGRVIIPSFAVERTQELIYFLHKLHDAGRIPSLPVYVDSPMAVSATAIFRAHPECYDAETARDFPFAGGSPFAFDSLHYVTSADESKKLNDLAMPCIIIASSGMCEGGRILHHLVHGVSDPRNTILIVGFMAGHTLGRALADKLTQVKIFGEPYSVKARVKILNSFSAHADWKEIVSWVSSLDTRRLKAVFLVHGEPAAQAHLKARLLEKGIKRVEILAEGESVELR